MHDVQGNNIFDGIYLMTNLNHTFCAMRDTSKSPTDVIPDMFNERHNQENKENMEESEHARAQTIAYTFWVTYNGNIITLAI